MALLIRATLVDDQKKPRGGVQVEACFYNANGQPTVIATGRSAANGRLLLRANQITISGHQPRVLLRQVVGAGRRNLSETPESYTRTTVNFGQLVVTDQPAMRLARSEFFATNMAVVQPAAVAAAAPRPTAPQLAQLTELNKKVASLQSLNQNLERSVAEKDQAIARVRAQLQEEKVAAVRAKEAEVARLAQRVEELQRAGGAASETNIEDLLDSTGQQLESASRRLSSRSSAFRLGKVSMQLKLLPGQGGTGVTFVKRDEIERVRPELLSVVNLEFNPRSEEAPEPERITVEVPEVTGYTRAMAQRKLREVELAVEMREEVVQPSADGPSREGRVIRQSPAAGQAVPPGAAVVITVARHR